MNDITKQPYSKWLEESLKVISEFKPAYLCIAATSSDGETFTGYYNADATDKAVFAHHIQSDVTMDIIRANIATIKVMLEDCDAGGERWKIYCKTSPADCGSCWACTFSSG